MNDHDDDLFRDDLFRKEMTGVAPLKDDGRVRLSRPQPPAWPSSNAAPPPPPGPPGTAIR